MILRIMMVLLLAGVIHMGSIAGTCNPNATPEARALLDYLVEISGKKVLSGQESMFSDGTFPSSRDKYVHDKTAKYPAIYTTDFGDVNTSNLGDRKKVVANMIAYSKKGSIIACQYHMIQPDLADGAGFSAMNIKGSTYTKIADILKEGSELNKVFNSRLDELAGYFNQLEENHVAVMYRPFHEMNGDFFWWSYQDKFKELWIYTWKYLTETKKCNNLLWVFGVNHYGNSPATSKTSPSYYYPGHEYVDILGCDVYTEYGHSYEKRIHDELRTLGGGKPIGISENGTMPDITKIRQDQPYWAFWSTWWGFEGSGKGNTDDLYKKNYDNEAVITQDELPLDQLRPTTAAGKISGTISEEDVSMEDASFSVVRSGKKIMVRRAQECERFSVFSVEGRCLFESVGSSGVITSHRMPPGVYMVRYVTMGHSCSAQITVP